MGSGVVTAPAFHHDVQGATTERLTKRVAHRIPAKKGVHLAVKPLALAAIATGSASAVPGRPGRRLAR